MEVQKRMRANKPNKMENDNNDRYKMTKKKTETRSDINDILHKLSQLLNTKVCGL